MNDVRISGNITIPVTSQIKMNDMHAYLMSIGVPYHSVSVIYRPQGLGLHCIFGKEAKEILTEEVINKIQSNGFTYSVNK